jgi:hypothetical protein
MILWCRFLRARKFDVPKAKAMLLSAEQWRKDEKVDELARCVIFSIFSPLPYDDEHFVFVSFCCASDRLLNPLGTERLNFRRRKR